MNTKMKCTVEKSSFLRLLKAVAEASLNKEKGLPLLSTVRLDFHAGGLQATCFNGAESITGVIPASNMELWTTHVPASTLIAVVESMDGASITLVDEEKIVLSGGPGEKASLNQLADDQLPVENISASDNFISLGAKELKRICALTRFASTDEARPVLMNIHLVTKDGKTLAEAANGFILARTPILSGTELDVLVPAAFWKKVSKGLEASSQIKFWLEGNNKIKVAITGDGYSLVYGTATAAGNFPNTDDLYKGKPATKLAFTPVAVSIKRMVDRIAALEKGYRGRENLNHDIILQGKEGMGVHAMAQVNEVGETHSVIETTEATGSALVVLNSNFLQDVFDAAGSLKIEISSPRQPVYMEGGDFTFIVMPMYKDNVDGLDLFKEDAIPVTIPARETVVIAA